MGAMGINDETKNDKISRAIGHGVLGAIYGFRIGILTGALILLLAWGWSPNALIFGFAVGLATCFTGFISGLATGSFYGRKVVLKAIIGALIASPALIAVTTKGIPILFQYRVLVGEHRRIALVLLKSVSPIHFAFAIMVGLIVGILIVRMQEEVYFKVGLRR